MDFYELISDNIDNEIFLSFVLITNRVYFDGTLTKFWICESIYICKSIICNSTIARNFTQVEMK